MFNQVSPCFRDTNGTESLRQGGDASPVSDQTSSFNGGAVMAQPFATTQEGGLAARLIAPSSTTLQELPDKQLVCGDGANHVAADLAGLEGSVSVCTGKSCSKRGSVDVLRELCRLSARSPQLDIAPRKCLDMCKKGPNLELRPSASGPRVVNGVHPQDVRRVLQAHFATANGASRRDGLLSAP